LLATFGIANSMQFPAMNSVTSKDLPGHDASSGNTLFSMAQTLAVGLGISLAGGIASLIEERQGTALFGIQLMPPRDGGDYDRLGVRLRQARDEAEGTMEQGSRLRPGASPGGGSFARTASTD
jgi:hypothetical protein